MVHGGEREGHPMTATTEQPIERSSVEVGGGVWRYHLLRRWAPDLPTCTFVMLNPSTANGQHDDPTIRACMRWARVLGCGTLEVVNLFAYRTSDPKRLVGLALDDAVGRYNNGYILHACHRAKVIVVAWGGLALAQERATEVGHMLVANNHKPICLGVTQDGSPKHPLARGRHRVAFDASLVRRYV
jgi:hypothetical protein